MTDPPRGETPLRKDPPRAESDPVQLDRWFTRLLSLLGTVIAASLWLLAAEALFLACSR